MWFGTRGVGATRWDGENWRTWSSAEGMAGDASLGFIEDIDGNLWSLGKGVSRFDGKAWQAFDAEDGLPLSEVFAALALQDGSLLFSGKGGVCRGVSDNFALLWHADNGLPWRIAYETLQDSRGDFWIATHSGLARFDGSVWTTYLHDTNVQRVLEDNDGNMWFGTTHKGAIRFDGSNWTTFLKKRTLLPDCVDTSGRIWFSSRNGGAWSFNGEEWIQYLPPEGPASTMVYQVSIDRQGNLWFATTAGASRFEPISN